VCSCEPRAYEVGVVRHGDRDDGSHVSDTSTESKRDVLTRAAYECFTQRGYHGTTVDQICRAAHVSKGSFYWHFSSKQEVFLEILETWAAEVDSQVTSQFHRALEETNPYDGIMRAFHREVRRGRAIMPMWLEFLAQASRDEEVRAAMDRFNSRIRETIIDLLRPQLSAVLGEEDIRALALGILATFIGMVTQDLVAPDEANFEAAAKRVIRVIQALRPSSSNE